VEQQL